MNHKEFATKTLTTTLIAEKERLRTIRMFLLPLQIPAPYPLSYSILSAYSTNIIEV